MRERESLQDYSILLLIHTFVWCIDKADLYSYDNIITAMLTDLSIQCDEGIPPLGDNAFACNCSPCKAVLRETAHWTRVRKENYPNIPIKLGDRVLVNNTNTGIVRYIGDLDSKFTDDQIHVGVKLDDPGMHCSYCYTGTCR